MFSVPQNRIHHQTSALISRTLQRASLSIERILSPLLLACLLLSLSENACSDEQLGSGCPDFRETADLCLEGSGSGSGDVNIATPGDSSFKSVCRKAHLVTWIPGSTEDQIAYKMVQDCPKVESSSLNTAARCETEHRHVNFDEMSLLLPVTSATTNVTYFNIFCFLCSGDPGPEVTWSINVSCSEWVQLHSLATEKAVLKTALESGLCSMKLQPQLTGAPDICQYSPVPSVPQDSTSFAPDPVSQLTEPEGQDSVAPLSLLLQFGDTVPSQRTGADGRGGRKDERLGDELSTQRASCSGMELVNVDTGRKLCFVLHCAPGKRLKGQACVPVIRRSRGLYYSLTLQLKVFVGNSDDTTGELNPQSVSSLCSLDELIKAGVRQHAVQLHTDTYNLTGWSFSNLAKNRPTQPLATGPSQEDSDNDLYFEEAATTSQYTVSNFKHLDEGRKEIEFGRARVRFDFIVTSDAERNDIELSAMRMSEEEWFVACGTTHARLVPRLADREETDALPNGNSNATDASSRVIVNTVIHPHYRNYWTKHTSPSITVCPLLICPFLILPNGEYGTGESMASSAGDSLLALTLMSLTAFVPKSTVQKDAAGHLRVCKSVIEEKFRELLKLRDRSSSSRPSDASHSAFWVFVERYLSLASVSLSLVGLLGTLVAFTFSRCLRTMPGQNLMALCCNLILAQALLQFGVGWTELKVGCVVIGMLIHYFWLAFVLWTNVCSFHMYQLFSEGRATRTASTRVQCCPRRLVAYASFSQGVPLAVVGTTASLSILLSGGQQTGYGSRACYLSSPVLVGVTFGAPLGFALAANLIFFLRSVREISKTEKASATNSSNGYRSPGPTIRRARPFPSTWRRNLNVCIRLSSVTGIFWTLELTAELLDMPFLRLLSAVANGSQGVLIAFSYLPFRRVARLCTRACCLCQGKRRQAPSMSSPASAAVIGSNTLTVALNGSSGSLSRETNGHLQSSEV